MTRQSERDAAEALGKLLAANPELAVSHNGSQIRELPPMPKGDARKALESILNEKRSVSQDAQQRGATNKASGAAFQDELDIYHAQLYRDGLALVHRTDPPVRYAGNGKWVVTGKGPTDYIAMLRNGVAVFDAKVRTSDAFSIGIDEIHQLAFLKDAAKLGHAAGYVVRWTDYDTVRWHDVATVDGKRVRMDDGMMLDGCKWMDATIRTFVARGQTVS